MAGDDDAQSLCARDLSPESRRQHAISLQSKLQKQILKNAGPGTRAFIVLKRVWAGVWNDGFIHAGNFAYMSLLSLFPFFIAAAAIFSVIGEPSQREASIDAVLMALPPSVGNAIGPVARDVVSAREGWLLWVGGVFGMWTASSLIETLRDILHRSYGTQPTRAFWEYRLVSMGVVVGSVFLLLIALGAQVAISAIEEFIYAFFPQLDAVFNGLLFSRLISAAALFMAIYLLFATLTPSRYQARRYPKWPGALFVTCWWVALILGLPPILRTFFSYDLTYGSLAGVMITLFFFWLVGLGVIVGTALNAALAVPPEEQELTDGGAETVRRGNMEVSE